MTSQDHTGMPPLRPGDPRDVAGYPLLRRIGEGGMGAVYLSRTRGGQPVAIKVIREEFARDGEFRRRFEQEVRAARTVQGYHVVPVIDHDTGGTTPWLACRYVPGLALDQALGGFGPLPLTTVFQVVGCVAEALRAVHAAGIVHRDLKPSNVLLASDGPWVIDFGIARAEDGTRLTASGSMIGTPHFMSPEQALGEPVTQAGDVFALGLIAAVAATERHPYGEGSAITLATRIANTEYRPPDLSGYQPELRALLARCLHADPAARATPEELADLCNRVLPRPLRAFEHWLPAPLAGEIRRRETAVRRLLDGDAPVEGPPAEESPVEPAVPEPAAPAPAPAEYLPTAPATAPAVLPRPQPPAPTRVLDPDFLAAVAPRTPAPPAPPAYAPQVPVPPASHTPARPRRRRRLVAVSFLVVGLYIAYLSFAALDVPDEKSTAPVKYGPVDVTIDSAQAASIDLDADRPVVGADPADLAVRWNAAGAPSLGVERARPALAAAARPFDDYGPSSGECKVQIKQNGAADSGPLVVGRRFCYQTRKGRTVFLRVKAVPSGVGPLQLTVTAWDDKPK
ncbi:serine/threonine-protein kinase [Kitasatospora sp. NPDC057936]|uniref:serine/threonine-protein kinase n=1 Tax=Kitasatospora sp. NPDC057936 TaxID=3346283 RepID=UPI0036DB175E